MLVVPVIKYGYRDILRGLEAYSLQHSLASYACDPAQSRGRRFRTPAPTRTAFQRPQDPHRAFHGVSAAGL